MTQFLCLWLLLFFLKMASDTDSETEFRFFTDETIQKAVQKLNTKQEEIKRIESSTFESNNSQSEDELSSSEESPSSDEESGAIAARRFHLRRDGIGSDSESDMSSGELNGYISVL